jgi:hypothetical protein
MPCHLALRGSDEGDHLHRPAATRTRQRVDLEDPRLFHPRAARRRPADGPRNGRRRLGGISRRLPREENSSNRQWAARRGRD